MSKEVQKIDFQSIKEELDRLIGLRVAVWTGFSAYRKNFETSISVCGPLEYELSRDQYRVLRDEGNYCYFSFKDIQSITSDDLHLFKDESIAVIKLKGNWNNESRILS